MTDSITIASRFCGPPNSGNGGYSCGLVAAHVHGPAEVTLRRPPPLERPLAVEQDGSAVRLLDGDELVAEGASVPFDQTLVVPDHVSVDEAATAGASSLLRLHPEEHPFPTCFVCGPDRQAGDGLGIIVGPIENKSVCADVWHPDKALAGPDGVVPPEFLWAALDCAGGIGAIGDAPPDGPPFVLGRLAVREIAPVLAGEPHVVLGWRLAEEGRKLRAGSALMTAGGEVVGLGLATWIRLNG